MDYRGNSGTASSVVMSSPLTFGGAFIWFNAGTPVNPNNPAPGNSSFSSSTAAAYFGPNFQFTVPSPPSVVPAPASGLLLLIGIGVLSIWRSVRRASLQIKSRVLVYCVKQNADYAWYYKS